MRAIPKSVAAAFALGAVLCVSVAGAQPLEPLYIVDHPTAGMLPSASYRLSGRTGPESSFLATFSLGFKGRLMIGASYGVHHLFEYGTPQGNDRVGLQLRLRILEEGRGPALALGFDSQGYGPWDSALDRYVRKAPGFYAVVSKNYAVPLGDLSFHGGLSVTTETDDVRSPNLYAGLDYMVWQRVSFLLDTDAALNDNAEGSPYGQGGIYLDAGIRAYFRQTLVVTLIFRDLTENSGFSQGVGREFEIAWISTF
jgi:hypothetical protein